MSTIALVFPGQGSQSIGMGRALAQRSPRAAAVWTAADDALGEPLSRLTWDGEASELDRTENAQPALLAASAAIASALLDAWGATTRPAFFAGHSMGQYSAMVAAEVLTLADGIALVRERGRLMQGASGDGAMAAVIGLDDARLPELEAAGSRAGIFAIANRNSPGQVVVSGERAAVDAAIAAAKALGAKRAIPLPVSVAAHSPLMAAAADGMRRAIAGVEFRDPAAPLLANADARPLTTAEACREELIEHLTRGVDWIAAVERMRTDGVTTFVEAGPGKVLTGLIRRIAPDAQAIAADDPSADGALSPEAVALVSTQPTPA
jgi:[acyl-carrier-protein] S-malonyltransferase